MGVLLMVAIDAVVVAALIAVFAPTFGIVVVAIVALVVVIAMAWSFVKGYIDLSNAVKTKYINGLRFLYEKHPAVMRRSYWSVVLIFVFSAVFLVLGVITVGIGIAIPGHFLFILMLVAVASMVIAPLLRSPENNHRDALIEQA